MNPDATDNPEKNPPAPSGSATPSPAPSGLMQTLKIAIPVVVLMAVIFGITFFSQYTPQDDDTKGHATVQSAEPPLRFFSSARKWHPFGSLQDQLFPGFYEVQANAAGTPNAASFWFENRNDKSVTMQLKSISCGSCSGGRVANLKPEVTRQILEMTALSTLPGGLISGFPVGMAGPAGNLAEDRLTWQAHTFKDNPKAEYKIPARENDPWSPQWGILELRFTVGAPGPKPLTSEFNLQVDGTSQLGTANFAIEFVGVEPFEISRTEIDAGDVQETAKPIDYSFVVYSSTRGPNSPSLGDLQPPHTSVQLPVGVPGEPGPFVKIGDPVRVHDSELLRLAEEIQKPVRITAAYRMTVTIAPTVGEKRADLGPIDREIHVTTAGLSKTIHVRGRVKGSIWLDGGLKEINLNQYKHADGVPIQRIHVLTQQPDAELVWVRDDRTTPDFVDVKVEKQTIATDRGDYDLKISVAGNKKLGPWNGFIVLELKGPNPQRIRIPIRGNATR